MEVVISRYVFDIETDGLLPSLTKIHCIGAIDIDTGEQFSWGPDQIREGLRKLMQAELLVGHHILGFDLPAIRKVAPWWKPKAIVRDTLVLARLFWPHIKDSDFDRFKAGKLPGKLIGSHSLQAWGYRLGNHKADYDGGWDHWTPEMQEYMDQDVRSTASLWREAENMATKLGLPMTDTDPAPGFDCIELEHRVAEIVFRVEEHGFRFDEAAAVQLVADLTQRKDELTEELQREFPPRRVEELFIPKVNNKKLGYQKGVPFTKVRHVEFNPGSRKEIGIRLMELGWKPEAYGKDGTPTLDEETLLRIEHPSAKLLVEYFVVEKRLGQISNGNEAWLRHARSGRIHGRIHSGGAHTGRMTHSNPNMAQVPANGAPYGERCRSCFIADDGMVLVGCDADGLELRTLAGYMYRWDKGAYINTVLKGDKAQGTDMHTLNAKAVGCDRDTAKVFFYALIYGAGNGKLGQILGDARKGKRGRERLLAGVPALGQLIKGVQATTAKRGFLKGLDGRALFARNENAALNTLLQSAGAVLMKRALVILYDTLTNLGWEFGREYAIVGLIHDEWQTNVQPTLANAYGQIAEEAIREAGRFYAFKCPLDAQHQQGRSWAETH